MSNIATSAGQGSQQDQGLRLENEARTAAPSELRIRRPENEVAPRLREAMNGEPQASFARRAGVAESVLRKYLKGAMPSSDRLVAMADAAGVSIGWLAAGRGPKKTLQTAIVGAQSKTSSNELRAWAQQEAAELAAASAPVDRPFKAADGEGDTAATPPDVERLQAALQAVESGLRSARLQLPADKHAELVVAAYELMDAPAPAVERLIRAMAR